MHRKLKLELKFSAILKPKGKNGFIQTLPFGSKVLDVGCGNESPKRTKTLRSDLHYTGVDIAAYNQSENSLLFADRYIELLPESFDKGIKNLGCHFDAVISSHNLEHCFNPESVLDSMIFVLKPGGYLFLSFPSEPSVHFPSRFGTLNYFDDPTHREMLKYDQIIQAIEKFGMSIQFATKQYKPALLYLLGLLGEPISRLTNRPVPFGATWAFYGFESIIISKKN
ncbi:MAG: class I SAM-dependent methyltransferase [Chloroherpetonaceae bacterium]|nr:class I SAM-dependent methyltransferase [Chloroherpetonaceae bacterium]